MRSSTVEQRRMSRLEREKSAVASGTIVPRKFRPPVPTENLRRLEAAPGATRARTMTVRPEDRVSSHARWRRNQRLGGGGTTAGAVADQRRLTGKAGTTRAPRVRLPLIGVYSAVTPLARRNMTDGWPLRLGLGFANIPAGATRRRAVSTAYQNGQSSDAYFSARSPFARSRLPQVADAAAILRLSKLPHTTRSDVTVLDRSPHTTLEP